MNSVASRKIGDAEVEPAVAPGEEAEQRPGGHQRATGRPRASPAGRSTPSFWRRLSAGRAQDRPQVSQRHLEPALGPAHPLASTGRERLGCQLAADQARVVDDPAAGLEHPHRGLDVLGEERAAQPDPLQRGGAPVAVGATEDAEPVQRGAAGVGDGVDLLELDGDELGQRRSRRRCGSRSGPGRRPRRRRSSARRARTRPASGGGRRRRCRRTRRRRPGAAALTFWALEVLSGTLSTVRSRVLRGERRSSSSTGSGRRGVVGEHHLQAAGVLLGEEASTVSTIVSASFGRYAAITARGPRCRPVRGVGELRRVQRLGALGPDRAGGQHQRADQHPVERSGDVDAQRGRPDQAQERQHDAADGGQQRPGGRRSSG